jgi:hemerythrin-like metal-binding protein
MATYVTWQDYYSVGDTDLDAQHRQILTIINDLYEGMQKGVDSKLVKPHLDRLVQYTISHFQY